MTLLAILWLPVLVIPFVIRLGANVADALDAVDYTLWALFAVEYFVKLVLAPSRWRFARTHVLDLVIIVVPLFRPLRALRLVRLLRAGSVAGEGLARSRRLMSAHGLQYVMLSAAVVVFAGAAAEYGFEAHAVGSNIHSYGDALWWAVATVTTVGYGDHYPVTVDGRGVAVILMLVGIGLIGVITANVAAFFVSRNDDAEREHLQALESRLDRIEQLLEVIVRDSRSGELDPAEPASPGPAWGADRRALRPDGPGGA